MYFSSSLLLPSTCAADHKGFISNAILAEATVVKCNPQQSFLCEATTTPFIVGITIFNDWNLV